MVVAGAVYLVGMRGRATVPAQEMVAPPSVAGS